MTLTRREHEVLPDNRAGLSSRLGRGVLDLPDGHGAGRLPVGLLRVCLQDVAADVVLHATRGALKSQKKTIQSKHCKLNH